MTSPRGRWLVLGALATGACSTEGKLPFKDDELIAQGGSSGHGGSGGDGGSGSGSGGDETWVEESCWPGESACDPRSNDGCDSEQACDLNGNEALVCFDPPNEQDLYDYCDNDDGPFCSGGLHCYQGSCLRFCCDSSDCDGAECEPLYPGSATIGVCLD